VGENRLLLTDGTWGPIQAVVDDVKSRAGAPPAATDRDFVEAVLYLARTGLPWRDLPERFGDRNAAYQRFRRWEDKGIWRELFLRLSADDLGDDLHDLFFDSTVLRAHQHAAGAAEKKGGKLPRAWVEAVAA
jgi:transposase